MSPTKELVLARDSIRAEAGRTRKAEERERASVGFSQPLVDVLCAKAEGLELAVKIVKELMCD